ncbi:hypothetical protein XacyCFBP2565_21255 [Xanthomonas arboricola pv. corylina]|nr:hypothetical protein XacyCFBP2565_21255 [Xanthomonas arboricola pv. corylina]
MNAPLVKSSRLQVAVCPVMVNAQRARCVAKMELASAMVTVTASLTMVKATDQQKKILPVATTANLHRLAAAV